MTREQLRLVRRISGFAILFLIGWILTDVVRYYL
jgi:hypothetical protein